MFSFTRSDRQMKNFNEMATRLDIDMSELAREHLGYTVRSAIRACHSCDAGEVCRDWLARAAPRFEKPPAFCRNAARFARVRTDQARWAKRQGAA
jgi:hypothetical protein